MVISSETWQTIEGLFQRGSKVSWQSLRRGLGGIYKLNYYMNNNYTVLKNNETLRTLFKKLDNNLFVVEQKDKTEEEYSTVYLTREELETMLNAE